MLLLPLIPHCVHFAISKALYIFYDGGIIFAPLKLSAHTDLIGMGMGMNFMGMRLQPVGMGQNWWGCGGDGEIFVGMGWGWGLMSIHYRVTLWCSWLDSVTLVVTGRLIRNTVRCHRQCSPTFFCVVESARRFFGVDDITAASLNKRLSDMKSSSTCDLPHLVEIIARAFFLPRCQKYNKKTHVNKNCLCKV